MVQCSPIGSKWLLVRLCHTASLHTASHTHYDSLSQYGAAVQLSEDGRILAVAGAPRAEDVNRNASVGAVYLYDVSIDGSMSANQYIKQATNNGVTGCTNRKDANGNLCTVAPKDKMVYCKAGYTLLNAQGSKIMINEAGEQVPCTDPPAPFFATLTSPVSSGSPISPSGYVTFTLSPYTTLTLASRAGLQSLLGRLTGHQQQILCRWPQQAWQHQRVLATWWLRVGHGRE